MWASGACSPALDWREVRPAGSGLLALFPCKPASHARRLPLAGAQIEMSLYACTAAGTTYAVAFADVGQPQRVDPALAEMAAAAARNIGAADVAPAEPLRIEGMTPYARSGRQLLAGRLADGSTVQEHVAVFARGSRVFQATVVGPTLEREAVEMFFTSLRLAG